MSKPKKFADIIERIEYLRNLLNLNKSRFSADIGMKPQTYNNFIGAQGSKPNVELIFGIVNQFGVNPMWLLNGSGSIFSDESKSAHYLGRSPAYRAEMASGAAAVHDERATFGAAPSRADLDALRAELKAMEPVLQKAETQLQQAEQSRLNVLDRCISLLRRFYEMDAAAAVTELRGLLQRMEQRLGKRN
jgi:transcriptional regulator with XRE-family HTH domain